MLNQGSMFELESELELVPNDAFSADTWRLFRLSTSGPEFVFDETGQLFVNDGAQFVKAEAYHMNLVVEADHYWRRPE